MPLTVTDLYLAARFAFIDQPDVRLRTFEEPESAHVVLVAYRDEPGGHEMRARINCVSLRQGDRALLAHVVKLMRVEFVGRDHCRHKVRYADQSAADAELVRMLGNALRTGQRLGSRRSYACPWCEGWHLTSREA